MRRRYRIDDTTARRLFPSVFSEDANARRDFVFLSRQVRTDRLPTVSAVDGLEQDLRRQVQNMRIHRRKKNRHGPNESILAAAQQLRADLLHFSRALIEARRLAAID